MICGEHYVLIGNFINSTHMNLNTLAQQNAVHNINVYNMSLSTVQWIYELKKEIKMNETEREKKTCINYLLKIENVCGESKYVLDYYNNYVWIAGMYETD